MEEQTSQNALKFFNLAETEFSYLYQRWQDEKEYEDIRDYQKPLDSIARPCGVVITKMNKSPFGCNFTVDGKTFAVKITATKYSYIRIK
jgi:hypothetical protein